MDSFTVQTVLTNGSGVLCECSVWSVCAAALCSDGNRIGRSTMILYLGKSQYHINIPYEGKVMHLDLYLENRDRDR